MDSAMGVSCVCGWLPAGWLLGLGRPCTSPNGQRLDLLVHLGVFSALGGRVGDAKMVPNIGMRRTSLTSELIGVGCLEIVIAGVGPSIWGHGVAMAWPWRGYAPTNLPETSVLEKVTCTLQQK